HRRSGEIVEAVDAAARQLVARDGRFHEELVDVLPELTGYSREMIALGLERMGENWTAAALREAIAGELGSLDVLDEFQPRPVGGRHRAFGPSLTVHVFSGNIPGVSVSSLIRALCVKSASFGKTAAGEPYLAVCFARALAEVDAGLASCIAVAYWPGGSEDLERVAFSEAEAVIAYGGDEAIGRIGALVPPHVRFLPYPNRVGAALVSQSALTEGGAGALARAVATDVVTFDQQGCVAPHTLYVERGGVVSPGDFARLLAGALDEMSRTLPRGALTPGESSLIHQLRAQAEIRGAEVLASERGTEWTVIVEERKEFEPSPLNRVIHVHVVDDFSQAVDTLRRVGRHLQTVAIAAEREEVTELAGQLGAIGATRLVPVGEAAWPSPTWHHDGRFQFMDLLRFVDLEL
ncbi:MAG TPA: acyl-CoA reductase, partial [Gemmatimonadota bacterium]|nr:acyl-CoA reductase [Gemmatimonadota bacterium]